MYVKYCKIFRENFTNLQLATVSALVNSSIRIDFLIWIMKTNGRSDVQSNIVMALVLEESFIMILILGYQT